MSIFVTLITDEGNEVHLRPDLQYALRTWIYSCFHAASLLHLIAGIRDARSSEKPGQSSEKVVGLSGISFRFRKGVLNIIVGYMKVIGAAAVRVDLIHGAFIVRAPLLLPSGFNRVLQKQ